MIQSGAKVIIARDENELKEAIEGKKVFIWDGAEPLHQVLEKHTKDLNLRTKLAIKGCKNVRLKKGGYVLKNKTKEKIEFSQLSDLGDALLELEKDDLIVIRSNDREELLSVAQQMIYLEKDIKVYLEEELIRAHIIDKFIQNKEKIKELLYKLREVLEREKAKIEEYLKEDENFKKVVESISNGTKELIEITEEVKDREIYIAIIATKKAGKSMVVNALLKEEYAPTSIELPTPNNIIYIPSEEEKITLEYQGKRLSFNSADEVKAFLQKEFDKVKMSGERLPDMTVYYPLKKNQKRYVIIDTPGPDLAGSKHSKAVEEILTKTDVVLFVIDYSKHAQTEEEQLLKRVLDEIVEKNQKLNSVFIVLNKIDLVFKDQNTEKIKLRIADFIYAKYKNELKLRHITVLPISALLGYYLIKLREEYGEELVSTDNIKDYLEEKFHSEESPELGTFISEVQNMANSFQKAFGIKNINYNHLMNFSGTETLESLINNVVLDKAILDYQWNLLAKFDAGYTSNIKNTIYVYSEEFKKKVDNLIKAIEEFKKELSEIKGRERIDNSFSKLNRAADELGADIDMESELELYHKSLVSLLEQKIKNFDLSELKKKLAEYKKGKISKETIIKFVKEDLSSRLYQEIEDVINSSRIVIEKETIPLLLNQLEKTLLLYIKNINKELELVTYYYENVSKKFKYKIKKDYDVDLPLEFPEIRITIPDIDVDKYFSALKTSLRRIREGVFPRLSVSLNQALNRDWFTRIRDIILELLGRDWTEEVYDKIVREYIKHCNELINIYRAQLDIFLVMFCSLIEECILPELRKKIKPQITNSRNVALSFLNKLDQTAENLYYLASIDKENQQRCLELFTTLKQEVVDDLSLLIREVFQTTPTNYTKT